MAQHILVVDDDPRICRLLVHYFGREGYVVHAATSGHEMRHLIAVSQPDLVILDVRLPGEDGFSLIRELRTLQVRLAIIMLTGNANTVDKVTGLELGADDYVTKPFDERELLARVRSVLRRTRQRRREQHEMTWNVASFAGWHLDLKGRELTSPEGRSVHLTQYEFQLLVALVARPFRVLTRDEILSLIAGRDWCSYDRSIDVLVSKLRRKISHHPNDDALIRTVRGVGYKFAAGVDFK